MLYIYTNIYIYVYIVKLTKVAVLLQPPRPCRAAQRFRFPFETTPITVCTWQRIDPRRPLRSVTDSGYCSSAAPPTFKQALSLPPAAVRWEDGGPWQAYVNRHRFHNIYIYTYKYTYIYIYIYARGPRFPQSILVLIDPYVKNHCFATAKGEFCTFFFFIL